MANEFAFLFYAGDYLRDTQNLSPGAQVAYDRIMCEHLRNICITYEQHRFFTKRLTDDERAELSMVLKEETGTGFYIEWVRSSIAKRRQYSESRRNNRAGKKKDSPKKTSSTYDSHMEIEKEKENRNKKKERGGAGGSKKFNPPTAEEVAAYMAEIDYPGIIQEEAKRFVNYYAEREWTYGKFNTKMKSWKLKVQGWKDERKNNGQQQIPLNPQQPFTGTGTSRGKADPTKQDVAAALHRLGYGPNIGQHGDGTTGP